MKALFQSTDLSTALQRIGVAAPEVIQLFDYIEDLPLWMKDVEGTYHWVNIPFVLNFGFKRREEVLGHNDYDLCGEALATQYRIDDERTLKGERIIARVELVGRFDHTARWCETTKIPLHDADDRVVGNAGFTRPLGVKETGRAPDSSLSEAIRYVSQHYAERITNCDLARVCGLSVRAFERQFSATYQCSPHEYIRKIRVRMSCSAVVFTNASMAELASEFGFADQSHFAKEFRRFMGETPSQYRARFKTGHNP